MRNGRLTNPQLTLSVVEIVTPLQSVQLAEFMHGETIATMNLATEPQLLDVHLP